MVSTGKICATVAGLAAVILVISQLQFGSAAQPDVVENWNVGAPAFRPNVMTNSVGSRLAGKSLVSNLPDSVFFNGGAGFAPTTVIGATNVRGLAQGAGGARMQLGSGMSVQAGLSAFDNFNAAADMVENYSAKKQHGHRAKHNSRRVPPATPTGCGPAGTIASGYGMSNLVGADFDALSAAHGGGKSSLLESSGTSYTSDLPVASMDGAVGASFNTDRLVYSTLSRAQCSGTRDLIRGDLPIQPCGQYMQTAARAADTLSTGAMAAMFGIGGSSSSAAQTAALVSRDAANGGLSALSGMNLTDLVSQEPAPSALNMGTFASTSAEVVANAYSNMNQAGSRMVGANPTTGSVSGQASPSALYTGFTSFP